MFFNKLIICSLESHEYEENTLSLTVAKELCCCQKMKGAHEQAGDSLCYAVRSAPLEIVMSSYKKEGGT